MATFLDDADETSLVTIPLEESGDQSTITSAPSVTSSSGSSSIITATTTTTEDESRSSCSRSSCDTASTTTVPDHHSDRGCSPRSKPTSRDTQPKGKPVLQGTEYIDAWETQILDYAIPNVKPPSNPTPAKTTMRDSRRDSRESFQTHQRRRSSSWSGHQRYSKPEIDFPPMQSLSDIASESSLSDLSDLSSFEDSDIDDDASHLHYHVTPPAPLTNRTVLVAYCGDTAASLHNNPDTTVLDMLDLISCLTAPDDSAQKFHLPHHHLSPKKTLSKRLSHQSINASSRKLASLLGPDFHGAGPARPPTSLSHSPSTSSSRTSLFRRRSLLPLRPSPSSASLASPPLRRASGPAASTASHPSLASSRSCDFRETAGSPRSSFLRAGSQSSRYTNNTNKRNSYLSVPGRDSHPSLYSQDRSPSRHFSGDDDDDDDDDDDAAVIDDDDRDGHGAEGADDHVDDDDDCAAAPPDILLAPSQHRWDLPYTSSSELALHPRPPSSMTGSIPGFRRDSYYHLGGGASSALANYAGYPGDGGGGRGMGGGRRLSTRLSSLFSTAGSVGRGVGQSHFVQ